jgi:hypothetical protein
MPVEARPFTNLAYAELVGMQSVRIGTRQAQSNIADAQRQGMFLAPQSVSALDINDNGRFIAVTTMAFRHDHNFWLISGEGKVLWGRYLLPWAPFQVAVLPGAGAFGVWLAYSNTTVP